eukprot:TRINITY_DN22687_c0_g1_i1.p1 TRINITY_DN22687_c0_g1~~TRINITY_DN22687_c0_g1_i1.p1  ORF type:complete len:668 (-),score=151.99 TRINITY_DN22687_c0_g1_i1:102-2105(-)
MEPCGVRAEFAPSLPAACAAGAEAARAEAAGAAVGDTAGEGPWLWHVGCGGPTSTWPPRSVPMAAGATGGRGARSPSDKPAAAAACGACAAAPACASPSAAPGVVAARPAASGAPVGRPRSAPAGAVVQRAQAYMGGTLGGRRPTAAAVYAASRQTPRQAVAPPSAPRSDMLTPRALQGTGILAAAEEPGMLPEGADAPPTWEAQLLAASMEASARAKGPIADAMRGLVRRRMLAKQQERATASPPLSPAPHVGRRAPEKPRLSAESSITDDDGTDEPVCAATEDPNVPTTEYLVAKAENVIAAASRLLSSKQRKAPSERPRQWRPPPPGLLDRNGLVSREAPKSACKPRQNGCPQHPCLFQKTNTKTPREVVQSTRRVSVVQTKGDIPDEEKGSARVVAIASDSVANWRHQKRSSVNFLKKQTRKNIRPLNDATMEGLRALEERAATWDLMEIAKENALSMDEIKNIQLIFEKLDLDGSGSINFDEFSKAIELMTSTDCGSRFSETASEEMLQTQWASIERSDPACIYFDEFVKYYSSNRFEMGAFSSPKERFILTASRKFGLSVEQIEDITSAFEAEARGRTPSCMIDEEEFARILLRVMKVSQDDFPKKRLKRFYLEVSRSRRGNLASYEDFLQWWVSRKDALVPYNGFYRALRPIVFHQISNS